LTGEATGAQHVVDLTWSAPSNSPVTVTGYNVYRAISGSGAYSRMTGSATTQTSYEDNSVQSGTKYDYYVASVDSAGVESAPSNQVTLTIP
jgi:penicillin-binding protein 2A